MRWTKALIVAAAIFAAGGFPAWADVVVVVSAQNAVTSLPRSQIVNIFLGRSSYFSDGERAVPIDQVEGSAIRNEFYRDTVGWSAPEVKAHWSKLLFTGRGRPPQQVANDQKVKERLVIIPGAIGYIDPASVTAEVKVLGILP